MRRSTAVAVVSFLLACTYLIGVSASAFADNRTENIDMFLVVDKSLSMESKIDAVKQYIDKSIIQGMLIPGDYLIVIDFWGKAHVLLSTTVGKDKAPIEQVINDIQANGRWTDIGNALDELKAVLKNGNYPNHRKYFMLITDGIQEAPPTSKYYSPSGKFNHAFLDNTKTIQEKGWKVEILGIGTETAAADLAKSLSGGYTAVSQKPTPQELAQKTKGFLGVIQASAFRIDPVRSGGKSTLHLTLKSSGYSEAKTVELSSAQLELPGHPNEEIAHGTSFTVPQGASKSFSVPITLSGLAPGQHAAKVVFTFTGNTVFTPAVLSTTLQVNGFVQNHLAPLIGGGVLVVLLILLAIFLIARSSKTRKLGVTVTVEGDLKQTNSFVVRSGGALYLQDAMMGFRTVDKRIADPVAVVTFDGTGLRFEIVNSSRVSGKDIPANVLGERVHLKTNASKDLFIKFDPA